jgi:Beta-ketoacyl synthase, N-terminal domain
MRVGVMGVGLLGGGLEGWAKGREVLMGARPFHFDSLPNPEASLLPANEQRRSTASVRWAVHVAQEAMSQSGLDPRDVATVFASSGGEMGVLDQLCRALATTERIISPTLFHHSVHNTAAGYWGIATSCQQSSTALSCYDDSGAAGLLEAVTYATMENCPVLFVSYDLPAPDPLIRARSIQSAFATALVLTAASTAGTSAAASVTLTPAEGGEVTGMPDIDLERLRVDNPSARLLPMLRALAGTDPCTICMNVLGDQRLVVEIEPECA